MGLKLIMPNVRNCGDCQLCCVVMSVDALGKGKNQRCSHQCESGCGIYSERPGSCRDFECHWLAEGRRPKSERLFHDDERPDKIGAVPTMTTPELLDRAGLLAIVFHLASDGMMRSCFNRISKRLACIVVHNDDRRTVRGPKDQMERWKRMLDSIEREDRDGILA